MTQVDSWISWHGLTLAASKQCAVQHCSRRATQHCSKRETQHCPRLPKGQPRPQKLILKAGCSWPEHEDSKKSYPFLLVVKAVNLGPSFPVSIIPSVQKFHMLFNMWKTWNWNIFTYDIFISHTKREPIHIWNTQFICEMNCFKILHLKSLCTKHLFYIWNISFTYEIFISHMELKQLTYERLF